MFIQFLTQNNYIVLKILFTTFLVSYLGTYFVKKIAAHVNAIDIPNERSDHTIHKKPIPRMGGLAIFIAFLVGYLLYGEPTIQTTSILIASSLTLLTGIIDDIKPIKARYKFIMQVIASLIIVFYGGIYFTNFSFLGLKIDMHQYVGQFLSVFFILSVTNAINLIDGLDGLSSGLSFIFFLTIISIALIVKKITGLDIALTVMLIGSTLGFLIHNFPPAKIFVGDTGTMFLGFLIPAIALLGLKEGTLTSIAIPVFILGIPILDTILAMIRRVVKRKNITSADKEHFHHQLLKLNLSHRATISIIYAVSLLFSTLAIFYAIKSVLLGIIASVVIFALLIFLILKTDILCEKSKNKDKENKKEMKEKQKD